MLDKRPYRESALLTSGLSPDYGKMSFVIHGAQKLSEKNFPAADLFRELEVEFEDDGNVAKELYTAKNIDLITNFDAIAENTKAFTMATRIGSFLLKNSVAGVPQPYTYDTLRSVLANLAQLDCGHPPWTLLQSSVILKTAHLYENGLLPEPRSTEQSDFLENLVASGIDNSDLPACPEQYWNSLNLWLNSLIEYHQLKR